MISPAWLKESRFITHVQPPVNTMSVIVRSASGNFLGTPMDLTTFTSVTYKDPSISSLRYVAAENGNTEKKNLAGERELIPLFGTTDKSVKKYT